MFNGAEDSPNHDQGRAGIHSIQWPVNIPVSDTASSATPMKHTGKCDKGGNHKDLCNQSDFHKDVPQILAGLREIGIGELCNA